MMRVLLALFVLLLPGLAHAGSVLVKVSGMDCAGCSGKLGDALEGLDFVDGAKASFTEQAVCGPLTGALDEAAVTSAIGTTGLTLVSITAVDTCPEALRAPPAEPWDKHQDGLDVQTISHGEEVDLAAHRADGKYTIFDFGAWWCAPCHEAAGVLAAHMREHDDVAVRAIELGGENPAASYEHPAVAQHLANAPGLPWMVVMAPDGKVLKRHQSAEKILAAIDKHRKRK